MNALPSEIIAHIASYMRLNHVNFIFPLICSQWNNILKQKEWWLKLANQLYGSDVWNNGNVHFITPMGETLRFYLVSKNRVETLPIDKFNDNYREYIFRRDWSKDNDENGAEYIDMIDANEVKQNKTEEAEHDIPITQVFKNDIEIDENSFPLEVLEYNSQIIKNRRHLEDILLNQEFNNYNNNNNNLSNNIEYHHIILERMLRSVYIQFYDEEIPPTSILDNMRNQGYFDIEEYLDAKSRIYVTGFFLDANYCQQQFLLRFETWLPAHDFCRLSCDSDESYEFSFANVNLPLFFWNGSEEDLIRPMDEIAAAIGVPGCSYSLLLSFIRAVSIPRILGEFETKLDDIIDILDQIDSSISRN